MTIAKPDILNNMQRVLDVQLLDGSTMQQIFEMRLVLEMGIIDLLFLRKTEKSLKKLQENVDKEQKTKNKAEKLKLDVEFHTMLYRISSNEMILRFQKMLLPIFDYVDNQLHVSKQVENASFVSHKVLLDTLRNGTPHEFKVKVRHHLINYCRKLQ